MEGRRHFEGNRGMTSERRVGLAATRYAITVARESLIRSSVADARDEQTRTRDSLIRSSMLDEESEGDLHACDPVTWLRDAVAIDTERWASQVSDDELARRYVGGGRHEWHPYISRKVAAYLRNVGFTLVP